MRDECTAAAPAAPPFLCGGVTRWPPNFPQVNTLSVPRAASGITHKVPSWNVSIDEDNKDQVDRYLKRQQRQPDVVRGVAALASTVSSCVRQNATVDVYELYYDGDDGGSLEEELNPSVATRVKLRYACLLYCPCRCSLCVCGGFACSGTLG